MKKTLGLAVGLGLLMVSCNLKETKTVIDVSSVEKTQDIQDSTTVDTLKHKLTWTAFKTPSKIGVNGSFDAISLTDVSPEHQSLTEALKQARFHIKTSSVNSNDPGRDSKLSIYFFQKLLGDITGQFHSFENGVVSTTLTMNEVELTRDFTYELTDQSLVINGSIDILEDFKAQEAFDSLHEICKDLHEGKTWSQVDFQVQIEK